MEAPASPHRPKPSKTFSFSRFEAPRHAERPRSRANTLQGNAIPEIFFPNKDTYSTSPQSDKDADLFVKPEDGEADNEALEGVADADTPKSLEDLPIEIRSLTERFLESLSAKVHPTPPSIDALSQLFQDFYERAEAHIATHIATLSSRLSRKKSPTPSISSKASRISSRSGTGTPNRNRSASDAAKEDQQLMSAAEILDKRKARKLLEVKRVALEEAVERAVCEKLYHKLYRHRSTDDEERDQKLRSRVAALHLVGIGFKELLAGTSEELTPEVKQKVMEEEDQIREWLEPARVSLKLMDDEHYPAGKLKLLTAAHKAIVETLAKIFPASSSADEVLPTLIYTLITTPPSEINVISHLDFIQRFRAASKVDGEAAYCMVNLEATISFLETVDLSSLRKSERPQGPDKSSRPSTPRADTAPMQLGIAPASDLAISDSESNRPLPSTNKLNSRRLSQLTNPFQSGAAKIEAASEGFRGAVLDGADQALDAINNTLDNSFKFMFGRLKEQQVKRSASNASRSSSRTISANQVTTITPAADTLVEMPKTLEDARKLVSPTLVSDELFDDGTSLSVKSDVPDDASDRGVTPPRSDSSSKLMDLVGGRRQMRERSVDSSRSGGSSAGKRVAFMDTGKDPLSIQSGTNSSGLGLQPNTGSSSVPSPLASPGLPTVESIRGFSNSLNPFNRMPAMGGLFGRSQSSTPVASTPPAEKERPLQTIPNDMGAVSVALTPKEARALAGIEELKKIVGAGSVPYSPTMKKFEAVKDVRELKIAEVEELLRAYQALIGSVRSVVDS